MTSGAGKVSAVNADKLGGCTSLYGSQMSQKRVKLYCHKRHVIKFFLVFERKKEKGKKRHFEQTVDTVTKQKPNKSTQMECS